MNIFTQRRKGAKKEGRRAAAGETFHGQCVRETISVVELPECGARSALECGGKRQRHAAFGWFFGRAARRGPKAPRADEGGVALTLATALQGASRSAPLPVPPSRLCAFA